MCLAGRRGADMLRISNRASTIAAILSIVLLVIFLVILWTSVQNGGYGDKEVGASPGFGLGTLNGFLQETLNESTTAEAIAGNENFTNEVTPKIEKAPRVQNKSTTQASSEPDLEYITLMKINENQYEDPQSTLSSAKKHHSGHFRHVTAEVWDLHPQYVFTAFGRVFRLRLEHDTRFVSPNIKITHMSKNTTRKEHPGHELGCFYSGTVDDDPESAVTVSLCHGMTGHVRTSTGSYIINPAEPWRENGKDSLEFSPQHAIQRMRTQALESNDIDDQPKGQNCGVIDDDTPTPISDDTSDIQIYVGDRNRERRSLTEKTARDDSRDDEEEFDQFIGHKERHRNFLQDDNRYERYYPVKRRRNVPSEEYSQDSEMESDPFVTWRPRRALPREYFIEIMVVADAKMVNYHGKGLFGYILVLMSMVSRIYKDRSIGNPISISVIKIVPTDEVFGTRHSGRDGIAATEMLKRFCYWQRSNTSEEPLTEHHDAALLLTREDLCYNPEKKHCDTLGLAELGRMCSPGSSCAIVQDNGLAAAFTIAHEIGHLLNMPHDDETKCVGIKNRSGVHNIMSRMLDNNSFPWEWSKCSSYYVTEFLDAGYGHCLVDGPAKIMKREDVRRLPGEDYSENKQCELAFGRGSRICSHMVSDVCRRLWCTVPNWGNRDQCHTQHMPWADGTPCGVRKWCHRGECVSRRTLEPVDGQWGEWGRYGDCSRTCGGGIKTKYRECNNPPPQNSGDYCVGERVKYRSCGTKECPPGSLDFRKQQCSQFHITSQSIQNLTKHTRIPVQDRCKLFCEVKNNQYFVKLKDKMIDGTPCGPDTFDICVNGQCKPAGCDHVLNSMAQLDACGVCRGDNSTCQRIRGSYNVTHTQYGYTRITKIPAGSSNIDIRQYSWKGSENDNTFLALRLGEGGARILNDKQVMSQKVIVQPGVTIEYSGPEAVVERLNSSRPIGADLILEVLSVSMYPPQITYEYTVPKKILDSYTWVLSNWSECSHTCEGMKYRRAECRSTEHKDVVSDDYCRAEDKPREESRPCSNHCTLKWQITSRSECSSHCGPGVRLVTSRCLQILFNSAYAPHPILDQACAHLPRPNEKEPCTGPCENVHWDYGEWDSCSVTCGGGVQYRTARCVNSNGRAVPEDNCARQEKNLKRICGQNACPKWDFDKWTACSVTCGMGKRQRQYLCHVDNRVVPNHYCGDTPLGVTEICNAGLCGQWQTEDWSPCSATCGEGTKRRKVVCKNSDGTISNMCSPSDKPEDIATCKLKSCPTVINSAPIKYSSDSPQEDPSQHDNEIVDITFRSAYKWQTGVYKECSKPCIEGFMSRVVECISIETETIAPDDYCDRKRKPPTMVPCNRHRCPMWNTGDWSQCHAECGPGLQYRQVRCQSPQGENLPDENCHDSEKPEVVQTCQKVPCSPSSAKRNRPEPNIFRKWKVSKWSACSNSCGSGHQRRRVECTMRRGNHGSEVTVKDEQCSRLGLVKPRSQRPCRRVACDYIWQEGDWSECSAKCGEGVQHRTVTCHRTNRYGLIDPMLSNNCPMHQKPAAKQSCKLRECDDRYYWTAGPWEKCSHTCGQKGRQKRKVFCHDNRSGKKVGRVNCPIEFRPPRKQKCNQIKCYPMSCLEAKRYFETTRDNEYMLVVGGRNMKIYCHGMATSEPKEYLTLPAGYRENYAEIYDKRLIDPRVCPYNGQRNDSCSCATDNGTISGKTMFRRIRIDPVKLYILENDYTFSSTKGANRIKYGMAGDCYSLSRCAQGRFSINLNGTQLRLSSDVTWAATPRATMEIDNISSQRVTGRCGGYCGFCNPKNGLKLNVVSL